MKNPATSPLSAAIRAETHHRSLLPALIVAGTALATAPALALELGEASVSSTLGQPLAASIAFALAPHEQLDSSCVGVGGGVPAGGLPAVTRANVSIANGRITVRGRDVVNEPIVALRLNVNCPYTPRLAREYMLFVDPARPAAAATRSVASTATQAPAVAEAPVSTSRPTPRPAAPAAARPILTGDRFRVQPGDSLSSIAARIENRPLGLWASAGVIFDANPDAFIDSDPNRLKAGAWLDIPEFAGSAATAPQAAAAFPPANTPARTVTETREPVLETAPPTTATTPDVTEAPTTTSGNVSVPPAGNLEMPEPAAGEPALAPAPAEPAAAPVPLQEPEAPVAESPAPAAATTSPAPAADTGSGGLVGWLLGGAVALIGGLLLLGGRIRGVFGSSPIGALDVPRRRKTDSGTQRLQAASSIEVEESALEIEDDSPTDENPVLDANLELGTGLSDDADIEVAEDFGFASTTDIDFELPEEMSSGATGETRHTDIIPPLSFGVDSILESEVLPEEDDDDYDMSVIVDATQMPDPKDLTERDLGAVELTVEEEPQEDSEYAVDDESVYELLEQDYEDEFTATQALNQEIAKAAAELAERLDEDLEAVGEDASAEDRTSELSLADIEEPAAEVTRRLAEDNTAEMPRDDVDEKTVEMSLASVTAIDEATAQRPAGDEDDGESDETAVLPGKRRSV